MSEVTHVSGVTPIYLTSRSKAFRKRPFQAMTFNASATNNSGLEQATVAVPSEFVVARVVQLPIGELTGNSENIASYPAVPAFFRLQEEKAKKVGTAGFEASENTHCPSIYTRRAAKRVGRLQLAHSLTDI